MKALIFALFLLLVMPAGAQTYNVQIICSECKSEPKSYTPAMFPSVAMRFNEARNRVYDAYIEAMTLRSPSIAWNAKFNGVLVKDRAAAARNLITIDGSCEQIIDIEPGRIIKFIRDTDCKPVDSIKTNFAISVFVNSVKISPTYETAEISEIVNLIIAGCAKTDESDLAYLSSELQQSCASQAKALSFSYLTANGPDYSRYMIGLVSVPNVPDAWSSYAVIWAQR